MNVKTYKLNSLCKLYVTNIKYVFTILIFLDTIYVLIEWIIYVQFRYHIKFRASCGRSPTSCSEIADQLPTSFNDSQAPILTKLVGNRSATVRGLVADIAGTCLRPNQSQPEFWTCSTSPGRIRDLFAPSAIGNWVEFIGVLRRMQQYFSHVCDDTDVQADWRRRAPDAIDIS